MFISHRNQSIDLQSKSLTGFYMRGTLSVKGLNVFKCTSDKENLFGRLFSRNARKTQIDQSTLRAFLVCSK